MPAARSLPPLIEAFLDMIAAERGASKNTQDAYARDLADYVAVLARAGKDAAERRHWRHSRLFVLACEPRSQIRVERKEVVFDPPVPPVSRRRRAPRRRSGADH